MVDVSNVSIVASSTGQVECAKSAGVDVMIDPDEVEDELRDEQEHIETLIQRSIEQTKDIRELKKELQKLKDDLTEDPIPSEQVEG